MAAELILSTVFGTRELTDQNKWYYRVWGVISNYLVGTNGILGDQSWVAPTLLNSWANFGSGLASAGYRQRDGVLYLRGAIKSGTAPPSNIFLLPTGYRPAQQSTHLLPSNIGFGRLLVDTSGNVQVAAYGNGGSNIYMSLDGIALVLT